MHEAPVTLTRLRWLFPGGPLGMTTIEGSVNTPVHHVVDSGQRQQERDLALEPLMTIPIADRTEAWR
jgi:hypothetical protein